MEIRLRQSTLYAGAESAPSDPFEGENCAQNSLLVLAGAFACGKGSPQSAADSTRSVELARADSLYSSTTGPPAIR